MGAVEEDGHNSPVAADNGQDGRVPRRAGGGYSSDCSRRKPRGSGDGNRGREEFVVHVASMGRAGRNYRSCYPVDRVAGRHDAAVQVVRDIVCSMGGTPPARRSSGGVGDAQVSGRRGICDVFKLIAGDAVVGLDCD
jgi:hypothetical protein